MPTDQPSEMMWCMVSSRAWSAGATRTRRARSSGAAARSKPVLASASVCRRCSLCLRSSGRADRSITGISRRISGRMAWSGSGPSASRPASKRVRKTSWRWTSPRSAAIRTRGSSGPSMRSGLDTL